MRVSIPKGSYHQYCRNKHASRSAQQSHRHRLIKQNHQDHNIKEFQNFQTYLMFLQQKQQRNKEKLQCQTQRPYRTADQSRPRTHAIGRQMLRGDDQTSEEKIVKPFFPFFKCKLESATSPVRDPNFRINNRKFKLNYRIIEENMGKNGGISNW